MPLGADDVQAAEVDDLLVFVFALALEVRKDAFPVGGLDAIEAVEVEEVDELLVIDVLLLALDHLLGDLFVQALLARHVFGVAAEQDVGAAARHVGGNRHGVLAAGLRHDLGFLRVILGVEHDVLRALLLEHARQPLGLLNRNGADQRRTSFFLALDDVVDDGRPFFALGAVDQVGLFDARHDAVGRDDHHIKLVNLEELGGLGLGRAGHARELLVLAEVILEGDGGERLVLALDLDPFLGLDRLVQAVAPAASRHQAAGELVDDHDPAVLDHVLHVELVVHVRP